MSWLINETIYKTRQDTIETRKKEKDFNAIYTYLFSLATPIRFRSAKYFENKIFIRIKIFISMKIYLLNIIKYIFVVVLKIQE